MGSHRWLITVPVALLCACGGQADGSADETADDPGAVSRADFEADGRLWPLTVDSGTVACEPGGQIIFTAEETTFAVNGTAMGADRWSEIDAIWAEELDIPGAKVNISDLIVAGQELCD